MSIIALASAVYSLMCCSLIPGGLSILPSALASPQMMLTALAQHLCAFVHMRVLQVLAGWANIARKAGTFSPRVY